MYSNPACLRDGKPCAPNGDGGCVACDDFVPSGSVDDLPCEHDGGEHAKDSEGNAWCVDCMSVIEVVQRPSD